MSKKFLSFFLFITSFVLQGILHCDTGRNSQYKEWLNSYNGEFDPLKYTLVSYRGNRQANHGREKLAPADLGGKSNGFSGNFYVGFAQNQVHGLDQAIAVPYNSNNVLNGRPAKLDANGLEFLFGRRLLRKDHNAIHALFSWKNSSASVAQNYANQALLPFGVRVHSMNATQKNDFLTLDLFVKKNLSQRDRYSAMFYSGIRFSDAAIHVTQDGINQTPNITNANLRNATMDYHFRNLGIGPMIGFFADTPISRTVRFALEAKQIILPSKGKSRTTIYNQSSSGAVLRNESKIDKEFTTFPITELAANLNFFWDHSTFINLGYTWSHWNFYEIFGFGNENFQDLTFQGPKASMNFHF